MYDEPTAGLDPVASTVVEDLIRDLHDKHGEGHQHHHHHSNGKHRWAAGRDGGANGNGKAAPAQPGAAEQPACPPGGITSYIVVTHQHSTIRRAGTQDGRGLGQVVWPAGLLVCALGRSSTARGCPLF